MTSSYDAVWSEDPTDNTVYHDATHPPQVTLPAMPVIPLETLFYNLPHTVRRSSIRDQLAINSCMVI